MALSAFIERLKERSYLPVILNRVVPQWEHLPRMALRPFLKVTILVDVISLFFFSFTQKALVMASHHATSVI